jgi:hypothetical protein
VFGFAQRGQPRLDDVETIFLGPAGQDLIELRIAIDQQFDVLSVQAVQIRGTAGVVAVSVGFEDVVGGDDDDLRCAGQIVESCRSSP